MAQKLGTADPGKRLFEKAAFSRHVVGEPREQVLFKV